MSPAVPHSSEPRTIHSAHSGVATVQGSGEGAAGAATASVNRAASVVSMGRSPGSVCPDGRARSAYDRSYNFV